MISLILLYPLVCPIPRVSRAGADDWSIQYGNLPILNILETARSTANFAVMLAARFIDYRMFVHAALTLCRTAEVEW